MEPIKLFDAEFKFLSIVWETEPVNSTELSKLCHARLGWKKPTTFNMIRKLAQRGILKNENATVTSLVSKSEIQKYESEAILEKAFDKSLPQFLAAFLDGKKLSEKEASEIMQIINSSRED